MFLLQYIQELEQQNNSFGMWGSHGHSIFERYYKNELEIYELAEKYQNEYDEKITIDFPPNKYVDLNQKYYETGLEYFNKFSDPFIDYDILGVEEKINIKVNNNNFTGYIDLILKNNNDIIIVDHKSKSGFKSKKELNEYLRQLYLYSIHIKEKYNQYPIELIFNMFRANDIVKVPFKKENLVEARTWFFNEIYKIKNDEEFKPKPSKFFCDWLCSVRKFCDCSDKYLGGD